MKFNGVWKPLAKVRNWSFSQTMAVLETTALGNTDRTLVDGVRSLSGSCSIYYYADEQDLATQYGADDLLRRIMKPYKPIVSSNDPLEADLGTTLRSGKAALKLQVDHDRSGVGKEPGVGDLERFLFINVYITNFTMTMAVGEVMSADITFESDGAPVENTFSNHSTSDD